jgi:hypothetical protein
MTAGALRRAFANSSRTFFSDCPTYDDNNSGPLTLKKFAEHSVATAFAISVLPQPGQVRINKKE